MFSVLVVGRKGLRLLLPETHEEIGRFPYSRMKEFSQNFSFKLFQFTWFPSKGIEESLFFKTSKVRCGASDGLICLLTIECR